MLKEQKALFILFTEQIITYHKGFEQIATLTHVHMAIIKNKQQTKVLAPSNWVWLPSWSIILIACLLFHNFVGKNTFVWRKTWSKNKQNENRSFWREKKWKRMRLFSQLYNQKRRAYLFVHSSAYTICGKQYRRNCV